MLLCQDFQGVALGNFFCLLGLDMHLFNIMENPKIEANRYLIRVVTEKDKQELFKLFIQHFCPRQPLRAAMFKKYPKKRYHDFAYWDIVKNHYAAEIFGKEMCLACFDSQNNNEMVGATLVKDATFSRYDLMKENELIQAWIILKKVMNKSLLPEHVQIIDGGKHAILDQWLYVMKQEHSGKGLLRKMVSLCEDLGREKGFQYSSCWATNCRSSKVAEQLGYQKIGEADTKEVEMQGEKVFEQIEEEHRINTLWLKKLSKQQGQ